MTAHVGRGASVVARYTLRRVANTLAGATLLACRPALTNVHFAPTADQALDERRRLINSLYLRNRRFIPPLSPQHELVSTPDEFRRAFCVEGLYTFPEIFRLT